MTEPSPKFTMQDLGEAIDDIAEQMGGGVGLRVLLFAGLVAVAAGGYFAFCFLFEADLVRVVYLPLVTCFLLALTPGTVVPRLLCAWPMSILLTVGPYLLWGRQNPEAYLTVLLLYLSWCATTEGPGCGAERVTTGGNDATALFTSDFWLVIYGLMLLPGHYVWNTLVLTGHFFFAENTARIEDVRQVLPSRKAVPRKSVPLRNYRPSGEFGLTIVPWLFASFLVLTAGGWLYQHICTWNNWGNLEQLPTTLRFFLRNSALRVLELGALALLVCVVALCVTAVVTMGKCRNTYLGLLLGLGLGFMPVLTRHYFPFRSWKTERLQLYSQEAEETPKHADPLSLVYLEAYFKHLTQRGFPALTRETDETGSVLRVTGHTVYLMYALEALLLTGTGMLFGGAMGGAPYDESAKEWMQEQEIAAITTPRFEVDRIEQANTLEELFDLPYNVKPQGDTEHIITYVLYEAESKGNPSYLTIRSKEIRTSQDGQSGEAIRILWNNIKLTPLQLDQLLEACENVVSVG